MVKEKDTVMVCGWCIARDSSELAYIWDSERARRTEIVNDRNNME